MAQIPPEFRKNAFGAVAAITAFILVYFVLLALSVGLVILCVCAGILIIINKPGFLTLLIGGGLMLVGIMVFVFLIKFLFASSKVDESDSMEITEADQPELFATINALTAAAITSSRPAPVVLRSC